MRVLLDHCTPKGLVRALPEHEVQTARNEGWREAKKRRPADQCRKGGIRSLHHNEPGYSTSAEHGQSEDCRCSLDEHEVGRDTTKTRGNPKGNQAGDTRQDNNGSRTAITGCENSIEVSAPTNRRPRPRRAPKTASAERSVVYQSASWTAIQKSESRVCPRSWWPQQVFSRTCCPSDKSAGHTATACSMVGSNFFPGIWPCSFGSRPARSIQVRFRRPIQKPERLAGPARLCDGGDGRERGLPHSSTNTMMNPSLTSVSRFSVKLGALREFGGSSSTRTVP